MSLFPDFQAKPKAPQAYQPLAYKLAPKGLEDYVGQTHLLGPNKPLKRLIEQDKVGSMILWGPPGCGKTSLAKLVASLTHSQFLSLNAVHAKVADIKAVIEKATQHSERTFLFIDELHRFTKLQQDALLPEVESGLLTLIGATTENPYFSVIPGLLSRTQVFELFPLSPEELTTLFDRTWQKLSEKSPISYEEKAKTTLIHYAKGDARKCITLIETCVSALPNTSSRLTLDLLESLIQSKGLAYDEADHYELISAFIKSMRGSDPHATLYWLARMLKGGEDPRFIARRLIIFASEDIGLADSQALLLATSASTAAEVIGMPEIQINLAHVAVYLAKAPKSNASYKGIKNALALIDQGTLYPVPDHLKNKPKSTYIYPHDFPDNDQTYLPNPHAFF